MSKRWFWWLGGVGLVALAMLFLIRPWESSDPLEAIARMCDSDSTGPALPQLDENETAITIDTCALIRRTGAPNGTFVVTPEDVAHGPADLVIQLDIRERHVGFSASYSPEGRARPQGDATVAIATLQGTWPPTHDGPYKQTPGLADATGTRLLPLGAVIGHSFNATSKFEFWIEDGMDTRYLTVIVAEPEPAR